jgi:NAD(P)H-dependent FMN reductase
MCIHTHTHTHTRGTFPTHEALCMGAALTGTRATRTRATLASLALRSTSTRQHSSPLQADGLNILVFQGSTRTDGPPSPACVGRRVALWVQTALTARKHAVQVVDPLEGPLIKPHFAYPQGRAPQQLEELAVLIKAADAFVMVTPEYNHAPSPALLNTLNHFGSSLFSFKPSAIVSYSQGQWYCTTIFQYMKDISDKINMNIDTHVFHYTTCPTAKGH